MLDRHIEEALTADRLDRHIEEALTADFFAQVFDGKLGAYYEQEAARLAFVKAPEQEKPKAKPEQRRRDFEFVRVDQLEVTEPDWIVDGLFESNSLGVIIGEPGCGKSFYAVDLSLSIATGAEFHGAQVKQGPVLFIAGEGHNGLARRFQAWSKARGIPLAGVPVFKSKSAAQFLDMANAREVVIAARNLAHEYSPPRLIVVDTLQRNFGGGDENKTEDMSKFVNIMDQLRAEFPGCTIVVVHHSGHVDRDRGRGSIVLKASADFEYLVKKKGSKVTVSNTKMKEGEPPAEQSFNLNSVEIGGTDKAGKPITSAVLSYTNDWDDDEGENLTPSQRKGIDAYVEAGTGDECWRDGDFIGVPFEAWKVAFYSQHTGDNEESKRKSFQRVRQALDNAGKMTCRDDVYTTTSQETRDAIAGARMFGGDKAR